MLFATGAGKLFSIDDKPEPVCADKTTGRHVMFCAFLTKIYFVHQKVTHCCDFFYCHLLQSFKLFSPYGVVRGQTVQARYINQSGALKGVSRTDLILPNHIDESLTLIGLPMP